jgi:hypothetical protein
MRVVGMERAMLRLFGIAVFGIILTLAALSPALATISPP